MNEQRTPSLRAYVVSKQRIRVDGKTYPVGATVMLDRKNAKYFEQLELIQPVQSAKAELTVESKAELTVESKSKLTVESKAESPRNTETIGCSADDTVS